MKNISLTVTDAEAATIRNALRERANKLDRKADKAHVDGERATRVEALQSMRDEAHYLADMIHGRIANG